MDKRHGVFNILKTIMYDMKVEGEPLDNGKQTIGGRTTEEGRGPHHRSTSIRVHIML